MAFEYDDGDLGLEDELDESEDYENEGYDIQDFLDNLITDDEEDEDDDEDNDGEDNDGEDFQDDYNNEEYDSDNADINKSQNEKDINADKSLDTTGQNNSGGRFGDTPPSQANAGKLPGGTPTPTTGIGGGAGTVGAGGTAAASGGAAALFANPYFWIAIGILLVVIILIIAIVAIAGAIKEQEEQGTLTFGTITSEYFYGMRLAYIDEDILTEQLQLSYKQYAIDVLKVIDSHAEADVTITLPEEFDNNSQIDENIINISIAIGNIAATGSSSYENIEFGSLYNQIHYFGLSSSQVDSVEIFLSSYITSNSLVTLAPESTVTIEELVSIAKNDISTRYIYNICQKVIIQDVLATEEEMVPFGSHKFVGAIYMPHKTVVVKDMSYIVKFEDGESVSSSLINKEKNKANLTLASSSEDYFEVSEGVSIELQKFTSINEENTSKYTNGISLFELIKLYPDDSSYFSTLLGIYTWQPTEENVLFLTFESSNAFQFNELYITCKNPNN